MSTPAPRRPLSGRHTKNPSSSTSTPASGTALTSQVTAGKRTVSTGKSIPSPNRSTSQSTKREDLTSKIANLETQNAQLSRHLADLTADVERTEQALVERDVLLERTRERCKGLEKEVGGWNKRMEQRVSSGQGVVEKVEPDGSEIDGPQEQGFDLEREQWAAADEQGRSKLERLEKERKRLTDQLEEAKAERDGRAHAHAMEDDDVAEDKLRSTNTANAAELARLAESLSATQAAFSQLQKAHLDLGHAFARSESTLREEKEINERLREENEVWEKLVGTRTIDGSIGIGLGIGFGGQSRIEQQGSMRSTLGVGMSSVSRASRRERGKSLADELGGFDLEAFGKGEMGETGKDADIAVNEDDGEMDKMREENEELRLELKQMSEANRGLRLYCSKILDRILSHSDSEQFLADVSSDPATSRKIPVRPTRQRQASNRSRPQSFMQQSNSEERVVQVDPKTGLRPLSMLAGRNDSRETASPEPFKEQTEAASEKRARRGLSLNWGSFAGFGGSGGTPSPRTENGPAIPEARSGRESPVARLGGRKLQTHEEDDEDRVERERLAATMKLMGVEAPARIQSPQLLAPNVTGPGMMQRSNSAQSINSAASSTDNARPARPVSRWSSFFGRSPSAEPASIESSTPITETLVEPPPFGDLAETIKQAHVQRKKEELETLKNNKHLTEAPKSVMDIIAARSSRSQHGAKKSVDSMGSLEDMRNPMTMQNDLERDAEHKPKGSISTLFDVSVHDS